MNEEYSYRKNLKTIDSYIVQFPNETIELKLMEGYDQTWCWERRTLKEIVIKPTMKVYDASYIKTEFDRQKAILENCYNKFEEAKKTKKEFKFEYWCPT